MHAERFLHKREGEREREKTEAILITPSDNTHDVPLHTDQLNTLSPNHNEMLMDHGVD